MLMSKSLNLYTLVFLPSWMVGAKTLLAMSKRFARELLVHYSSYE